MSSCKPVHVFFELKKASGPHAFASGPQDVTQRNSLSSKVREWREFPKIVDKEAKTNKQSPLCLADLGGFTRHVTKLPNQFKIIAEIIEASQSQLIV